jgi:hypothetical protein
VCLKPAVSLRGIQALAYSKEIKLPAPRASNKVYGGGKKHASGGTAGSSGVADGTASPDRGRMSRQNSRKVTPGGAEAGDDLGADSPATQNARKR